MPVAGGLQLGPDPVEDPRLRGLTPFWLSETTGSVRLRQQRAP